MKTPGRQIKPMFWILVLLLVSLFGWFLAERIGDLKRQESWAIAMRVFVQYQDARHPHHPQHLLYRQAIDGLLLSAMPQRADLESVMGQEGASLIAASEEALAEGRRRLSYELALMAVILLGVFSLLWMIWRQLLAPLQRNEVLLSQIRAQGEDLVRAKEAAENASRAKTEFLSSMSHELRTPLHGILGFAQLLENGRREPLGEKQREHVQRIRRSGEHLLMLINDILDLTRIENGNLTMSLQATILAEAVESALLLVTNQIQQRGIQVHIDANLSQMPLVLADETRLRQVLVNLLSNATKYNREGGEIWVRVQPSGQHIRLSIEDTGMGIPVERQDVVFQPFQRLGQESTEIEGTGIGLTISRQFVEKMGGHMGFWSAPGSGSLFWLDLMLAVDAVPLVGQE